MYAIADDSGTPNKTFWKYGKVYSLFFKNNEGSS
jgi:hypothetical protein